MKRLIPSLLFAVAATVGLWATAPEPSDAAPETAAAVGHYTGASLLAIDSANQICFRWKPHNGDGFPSTAFYYYLDLYLVKTQCVVPHPPDYYHPNGGTHTFCVYTRASGETWIPGCYDGF